MFKKILHVVLPPILLLLAVSFMPEQIFASGEHDWVGTWAAAPSPEPVPTEGQSISATTFRNIVHISVGGKTLRVKITNEFGLDSLTIGQAAIANSAPHGAIISDTLHRLSFGGRSSVVIPAGAFVISDPVAVDVPAFADLAISIFVPRQTVHIWTRHTLALQENFQAPGNQILEPTMKTAQQSTSWYLLKAIDVQAEKKSAAIVTLGDSITDGVGSRKNANHRWPDVLADRLAANKKTNHVSVLNLGISGNRILHDGTGPNAISRFDRDVLTQSGAKYLIILESINDINRATRARNPEDIVSAADLEWALSQLVKRAHEHGIKVYGATLTPAGRATQAGQQERAEFNEWIRTSGVFDAVLDFAKVTRDPADPAKLLHIYDSGDQLHPSDAGYNAMAGSIDLSLFR